ncbi:beta subunit of citrate lyase [Tilletiaria anomala UBC 951]|uniref:Beta subunit of citrate lyase n=1 Tax=Tilletiaria anomala (strain ATCC 24038 / CBS 436.72 / UBC 951) TaxID=1037660 RepID=A0A066WHX5_TILAU|nr:beta subunit of citrate lyase [Tilletiaria anomala UBC 951]KDN53391.1 beta subunit of citrate lyase [Tilletiaria anomala UBC 951]
MLYVPGSSEKMIKKSQESDSDCIIFDLEDSVAAHRKGAAREAVLHGLNAAPRPGPELAVRINPPSGDHSIASDDLDIILPSRQLQAIVMPKVESSDDVKMVLDKAEHLRQDYDAPLSLILSVESAASLLNMPHIIEEVRSWGKGHLAFISALLFASEDYCAATSIIRTKSRRELLFPRAHMATIAKAYGLAAIDMVCVDYKDASYLAEECRDGRELGFDGKQAIHPAQVAEIQRAFSPSEADVLRAARIKHAYEQSVKDHKGAVGMKEGDSMVMIDAPMLKQASDTLAKARIGKMKIPDVSTEA